jgi:hypothetical protein
VGQLRIGTKPADAPMKYIPADAITVRKAESVDEEISMAHRTKCQDCRKELKPIRIIESESSALLAYSSLNAQRDKLTGKTDIDGFLISLACTGCGRIYFYTKEKIDPATTKEIATALDTLATEEE